MKFFKLGPEVAGWFGRGTRGDLRARPPQLTHLNYELDIWPDDPLVEFVSTFIVAEPLKECLLSARASGVTFGKVEITKSEVFKELYPDSQRELPTFSWLQVTGRAGKDDFGLSERGHLIVSERILKLLQDFGMQHCDIAEYHGSAE